MSGPLSKVDWDLLRAQRNWLLETLHPLPVTMRDSHHADGLINFLDTRIDHALDTNRLIGLFSYDDLQVGEMYKYVRVEGNFRFFSMHDQHSHAVGETEREMGLLESAGKIAILPGLIRLVEAGSMSLDLPGDPADVDLLAELLGKPVKRYHES